MSESNDTESKRRWSRRMSTILDADETVRELNGTIVRMNGTLDEFDTVLTSFTVAMNDFVEAVERFDGVVGSMDTNVMPRIDALLAKAESLMSVAALPALGAQVVTSIRKGVLGVAGAALGQRHD